MQPAIRTPSAAAKAARSSGVTVLRLPVTKEWQGNIFQGNQLQSEESDQEESDSQSRSQLWLTCAHEAAVKEDGQGLHALSYAL